MSGPATVTMTLEGLPGGGFRVLSQTISIAPAKPVTTPSFRRAEPVRNGGGLGDYRRGRRKHNHCVVIPHQREGERGWFRVITRWCRDNAQDHWSFDTYQPSSRAHTFRFKSVDDAILFQLRFGGASV